MGGSSATTIEGVFLYGEPYLMPTAAAPDASGLDLLAALHRARDASERERVVRAELAAIGADWLEFGKMQWQGERAQPVSLLCTYAPPDWTVAYCRNRFWECDARLKRASLAGAPCVWSVAGEPSLAPAQHMFRMLAAHGVGSGITICLGAPASGHGVAMHFLSRHADHRWATKDKLAAALLLGVCLHEFIAKHTLPVAANRLATGMSALQARIADCVQRGFSDKEVARSLALSPHTVDYHLRALRHRFKVRNRVQLAQAIGGMAP
ncbi:MAG TPA: autoinducer binding domain-containing protein [Burkholderiaceae bacterium]|nr:autoinducer binding domain-containing protein [Burkholderiaceae bacterium]